MVTSNDRYLCNGVPVDHRLRRFLPSANRKDSQAVGNHGEIIEHFGNTMVRDDKTFPSSTEAGFAAWLAKPDMQGGLVIALLQPAKTQVYTPDFHRVRDECPTLAYLHESLTFVDGPGGLATTSVFDAFPFITEQISSYELSTEAADANDTFHTMLEAKKPDVVFACWRVKDQDLPFSGKGVGSTNEVEEFILSNGHVVRVVNGFHPSYTANYWPNESRFRRLFTMELCKAFCEMNGAWQEEKWMEIFRWKCQQRRRQLNDDRSRDGGQLNSQGGRVLRGSRGDDSARKYRAYTESFDNGLQRLEQIFNHMVSQTYRYQSSWDLYSMLVFNQNTSEGICDALLAVSVAMKRFLPGAPTPDSSLIALSSHISRKSFEFVRDYIPDLLQSRRGLYKYLWRSQFEPTTSQGLKLSIETNTIQFVESLIDSFSDSSRSWTYTPELLHDAFKDLAVNFEDSLAREYDNRQQTRVTRVSIIDDDLSASLYTLSLASSQDAGSGRLIGNTTPARSSNVICFTCHQPGHISPRCPNRKKRGECFRCGEPGHFADQCSVR